MQFFLVYNTYKLKDEHFYLAEKRQLNDQYGLSIRNDKVFPGGARIIDHYIYSSMNTLEMAYREHSEQLPQLRRAVSDSIFAALRAANNMDSVLSQMVQATHIKKKLRYLLTVEAINITFRNNQYMPLFDNKEPNPFLDSLKYPAGVVIGGTLTNTGNQNLVTNLTVSSPADHSYQMVFSLYIDTPNREILILEQMLPTFILSLLTIGCIVGIYYITFRNWLKQKKLAEMKSDFVNSITHEFNTPLAAIIIANKNLQNEKINADKNNIQSLTRVIERQSQRLKHLFGQVLGLTVMNKDSLQKKNYVLHELLDEIMLDYRLKLPDNNVEILLLKAPGDPVVNLDRFWFTTMLFNIFDNAIKYNNHETKQIVVTTSMQDNNIRLHIQDNGVGMSAQTVRNIFEKFYRNKNVQENTPGLGLGLFYTRQCVDAHDWKVEVESQEGAGSAFIILIPGTTLKPDAY